MRYELESLLHLSEQQKTVLRQIKLHQIKDKIENPVPQKHPVPSNITPQDIKEIYDLLNLSEYEDAKDLVFMQVEVAGMVIKH